MSLESRHLSFILPAALLIGSVLAGLVLRAFVLPRLLKAASRSSWRWDDALFGSLVKMLFPWSLILGCYLALPWLHLPAKTAATALRVLHACAASSVTLWAAIFLGALVQIYADMLRGPFHSSSIFRNLTKGLIITIGALVILQTFGISITPILTALGVGGLAVALAVQEPLANFFAGLQVLLSEQIRVGDYVRLSGGEEGTVRDITWRTTVLQPTSGQMVIIPNGKLAAALVTNYSLSEAEVAIPVECVVPYGASPEAVEKLAMSVAAAVQATTKGGIPSVEPMVRFHTFGDSSLGFTVTLRAKGYADCGLIKHEFVKRFDAARGEAGITFPYPVRRVVRGEGTTGQEA